MSRRAAGLLVLVLFFGLLGGRGHASQCVPAADFDGGLRYDQAAGRWSPESQAYLDALQGGEGEFRVGTKRTPGFAMRPEDGGDWEGIGFDLWQRVWPGIQAEGQGAGVCNVVEFTDIPSLVKALEDGHVDAAVAAMTITGEREARIDFSSPFFFTGLGIAVMPSDGPQWMGVFHNIFNSSFLKIIATLVLISVVVTTIFWLLERNTGNHHFNDLPNTFLWAISVLTNRQASPGDFNRYLSRLLSVALTMVLVTIFASYTAWITATLTTQSLGAIQDEKDLRKVHSGAEDGTVAAAYLQEERCSFDPLRCEPDKTSLRVGLERLQAGAIGALVHDAPILQYEIRQFAVENGERGIPTLLPTIFKPQYYALGLPEGSPHLETINAGLLKTLEDEEVWGEIIKEHLGEYSLYTGKSEQ